MTDHMRTIIFRREGMFYPTEYPESYSDWQAEADRNPGTTRIETIDGVTLWPVLKSTAVRKDVHGLSHLANSESQSDGDVTEPAEEHRVATVTEPTAGTQAPPVDTPVPSASDGVTLKTGEASPATFSETPGAGAPAAGEAVHTRTSPAVPGDGLYSYDWLRRHDRCLDPDGCKPMPGKLCVKCSRAMPVVAGGVHIPHEGQVA